MEGNQPIVIDNGSGILKAGFAGTDKPKTIFRSIVGRTKHVRLMPGGALEGSDIFIGSKVDEHRGVLSLSYPIEHGVVQNWSDMERLWNYIYSREGLNVPTEDHAVLLTEAPLNPLLNREKSAEIFFEGFNVPALFCSMQAILSLYASGRTTGIVLDSGDGVTHIVPVYEGFAIPHGIQRMDIAGRDITNYLQLLLRRSGYNFYTTAENEVVRLIKENSCVVATSASEIESLHTGTYGVSSSSSSSSVASGTSNQTRISYSLPDGQVLQLSSEVYRAPELLFQPDLIGYESKGVNDHLVTSITRCDIDVRKLLYSQIVLSGGSTLFKGFGERLLLEVRKHRLAPRDTKIRIAAPPERLYTTWIGGSILASLGTFKSLWISRQDYIEHGLSRLTLSKHQL